MATKFSRKAEIEALIRSFEEAVSEEPETAEAAPEEATSEESAPEVAPEVAPVAPAAPVEGELSGMLADSWYGEGPEWDLTPISQGEYAGSMLDHKTPLPTDGAAAAPAAPAEGPVWTEDKAPTELGSEETEESEEVEVDEESDEESDEDASPEEEKMMYQATLRLTKLAIDLDAKGYKEEADLVDEILSDLHQ